MTVQKVVDQVLDISENIADDYITHNEVLDIISSDQGRLYLSVGGLVDEYSNFEEIEAEKIEGFLTARIYRNFTDFKEVEYAHHIKKLDYYSSDIFPIMNLKTISVRHEYQNQNIGSKISFCAFQESYENQYFPLIGRIWNKGNGNNSHLNKAVNELGAKIIAEEESFLDEFECKICNEYKCDCSKTVVVFENIW